MKLYALLLSLAAVASARGAGKRAPARPRARAQPPRGVGSADAALAGIIVTTRFNCAFPFCPSSLLSGLAVSA